LRTSTPADLEELQRVQRVSDQLATIHATLRDGYHLRALVADTVLLAASVALCTLALADPEVFGFLSIRPVAGRVAVALLSAAVFLGILLTAAVDWKGRAAEHSRASQTYSALKLRARELLAKDASTRGILMPDLLAQYSLAGQTCPAVPDRSFAALKAAHVKKVFLSRSLDKHPCMSVWVAAAVYTVRQTWDALRPGAQRPDNGNDTEARDDPTSH